MTRPDPSVQIPASVLELAEGTALEPIWLNELGGLTFRAAEIYIKWNPLDARVNLAREAEKLSWAVRYTPVPKVIEYGADAHGQWLVTEALPGTSAVDDRWINEPDMMAHAIGRGLRAFHDAVPVSDCPYNWSVESRIDSARANGMKPNMGNVPTIDALVVCHGDACAPNTMIDDDGMWSGHVDLGSMGVADRWADLAPAVMSTEWNYGALMTEAVLDGYGIDLDEERLDFYCRLWDRT